MLVTGKSFELLGLASFNIFLAMILSVTFLGHAGKSGTMTALTQDNVEAFIKETTDISAGKNPEFDNLGIAEYLMAHIQDGSRFAATV